MNKIRLIFLTLFFIGLVKLIFGQQDPHFTQYMDNTVYVNPAYSGSRGMLNITGIARFQWVGFKGAPNSQTLSLNTPLKYESIGLGFSIVNDKAGPLNQTMVYGDFSYTFKLKHTKNNGKLAFGVKAGINVFNSNTSNLNVTNPGDKILENNFTTVSPNFGLGIYYHTDNWYVGFSSPKILELNKNLGNNNLNEKRHYFLIGGYVFTLGRNFKLRPTTLFKVTPGSPLSWDLSLALIIRDKFTIGAMHRFFDSAGGFFQYQFSPQFKLGYAFDISVTKLIGFNYGTHEIMLSYDFNFKNKKKILSPRYF